MTLQRLQQIYHLKETEDILKDESIDLPSPITKIDDIRTNIEDLDDYLLRKRGETGLPLAYVVRAVVALPGAAEDPGFGLPDHVQEMVARGDHATVVFQNDNKEVWNVIRHLTHGGNAWGWVSQYARGCNGRQAYQSLKAHYLGPSYRARIQAACDSTIQKTYFDGTRNFTFESYTTTLQKTFTDLELCGEAVTEGRKVRILLNGILASALQPAKGTVSATPELNENFDQAVNFLAEQNDKVKAMTVSRRSISSINTAGTSSNASGKGKNGKAAFKTGKKKTKHYKHKEWWSLTEAQREKIREERKKNKPRNVSFASTTSDSNGNEDRTKEAAPERKERTVSVVVSRRQNQGTNN
jgi:hypothetical protein